MSKSRALVCLLFAAVVCNLSFAVGPDRVNGDLASGPKVALRGNVHGLARPEFDLGRADSNRLIQGISLNFRPSAAQQKDLDQFIAQLGDRSSPNYHKYLTPTQFGRRFGLSQNDIGKVTGWLQSQGFTNIAVANGRNQISFDGSVGQIESAFRLEMHNFVVNGEIHLANAGEPSLPSALLSAVVHVGNLNDFAPRPRAKIQPHLTSFVSGNHFLSPGDFATIYDLQGLYTAGADGSGQKIAVIGQSSVSTTDLNNFRSAAGLPASTVTMTLAGGTSTRCGGDEGESDLDIEWAGGVAKKATIIFVYAGLGTTDSCGGARGNSVWNALDYAVQHNTAPFISISYGFCEAGLGNTFILQKRTIAKQGITQGQTIVSASGDAGAADCDSGTSATQGLAVDVPAAIPEVTGAGGNEFSGDVAGTVTGTPPNTTAGADMPYWSASGTGSDTVSSAQEYIPEMAWNDTANVNNNGTLSASGGGASTIFLKSDAPWQVGTGVPNDGKRDVPDISMSASQFHDPYLICSEDDGNGGITSTCTAGFRTGSGGNFTAVGGTSASAPTFSGILALVNQYIGNNAPTGLAPVNPMLYSLAASTPSAFHDVKTGDNKVPCTTGTPNCTTGSMGFSAGTGYDQVTGLGSVDALAFAQAWAATIVNFSMTAGTLSPASIPAGTSGTTTITIAPQNGFTGTVTLSCSSLPSGVTCTFNPPTVASGSWTTQLTVQTPPNMAAGSTQLTVKGTSGSTSATTAVGLTVSATSESYSLTSTASGGTVSVARGQISSAVDMTVTNTGTPNFVSSNGSGSTTALPVSYTCAGLPSESTCQFSPSSTTSNVTVSLTITTRAPTAKLQSPFDRGSRIFYAALLPGLLGIVFSVSLRKRPTGGLRVLGLIAVLGFSSLWMASCGGTSSSSNKDPGTPTGSYNITVNATTTGAVPLTSSLAFTLAVTP